MNGWRQFVKLCAGRSEEELEELFSLFFTLAEKEDLSDRCVTVGELLKGEKSQRQIAEELGVSIAKITRGSNALRLISDDLKQLILSQL